MKTNKHLVIMDANLTAWANHYTHQHLKTSKGRWSGAFYGFLKQLGKLSDLFSHSDFIAVFDGGHSYQSEIYPEYKANRPPKPKEVRQQIIDLRKVLKCLGIAVMRVKGVEADSLIGLIVNNVSTLFSQHYEHIYIVTSDEDYFQLLKDNVSIYDARKQSVWNVNLFKHRFKGLQSHQHTWLKAIQGCSSDNIPGIRGIGEKKGCAIIRKTPQFDNFIHLFDDEAHQVIERNLELVTFPRDDLFMTEEECSSYHRQLKFKKIKYDKHAVEDFMSKYEMRSFRNDLKARLKNIRWDGDCI